MEQWCDWYRFTCSRCGQDITFPVQAPVHHDEAAVRIAMEMHIRNNNRGCDSDISLTVQLLERNCRL